jgi:hypothetical protein
VVIDGLLGFDERDDIYSPSDPFEARQLEAAFHKRLHPDAYTRSLPPCQVSHRIRTVRASLTPSATPSMPLYAYYVKSVYTF